LQACSYRRQCPHSLPSSVKNLLIRW
jgi:hypothetical protein